MSLKPGKPVNKMAWSGTILAVQPWIELSRSYDIRQHSYLGYSLRVEGECGSVRGEFLIRVGKAAHAKHQFHVGATARARSEPVTDLRSGIPLLYRTSQIRVENRAARNERAGPPYHGVPESLDTYRARGHLRLDEDTYWRNCSDCVWACLMQVTMTIDHWNPDYKEYRTETFCYGPKGCALYNAGKRRVVPGRNGMEWEEPDWVDAESTSHREPRD